MSRWNELVDGHRAEALRVLLCRAAAIAHRENGARFDPEDLGDDALIYGLCTTHNARHLAARLIEDADLDGVAVCERGRVWWLEVQRPDSAAVRVYFYKAPPGARTVYGMRLDDAEVKKELSTSNGRQLEIFNRNGGPGNVQLLNVLVVHYGDPVSGLERVDVGAPYLVGDRLAWEWDERFDTGAFADEDGPTLVISPAPLGDDGRGFAGLRLVEDSDDGAGEPAAASDQAATSEFEALSLKVEHDADTDSGEEPG